MATRTKRPRKTRERRPRRWWTVRNLGPRQLGRSGPRRLPGSQATTVYRFTKKDLGSRPGLRPPDPEHNGHDLKPPAGAPPVYQFPSVPCILILLTKKVPGGGSGSLWNNSNWWRNETFLKKLDEMFEKLDGCFDDACIYVYTRLDLSAAKYRPHFIRNQQGGFTNTLNLDTVDCRLVDKIRQDLAPLVGSRCITVVFSRGHGVPSSPYAPSNPGTTPIRRYRRGPRAGTRRMENCETVFAADNISGASLAHEMAHVAGITHAADNLIHNNHGRPDPAHVPHDQERAADDLLRPKPADGATIRPEDCARLRDWVWNNTDCNLGE